MTKYVLAIDQGTTSSRAILFDADCAIAAIAQREFPQYYPQSGWVEHDAEDLWETTLAVCREAMAKAGAKASDIASIGITNQRETTIVWDRITGKAIHRAIVWQDRRTADYCAALKVAGHEPLVNQRTGLLLDPYFSATKISWILDNVEGARAAAQAGDLAFGTVDSFILWRLTNGKTHATDVTNASRTLLFDINKRRWCDDLLDLFSVPSAMLPEVKDCAARFGATAPSFFGGAIAICGVAGDQQAAAIGQACFKPGMVKSTYGTGCFALLNTGAAPVFSKHRLLTTIAYSLRGEPSYALEGSIFIAGAAVQWLQGLGLVDDAAETDGLAAGADSSQDVYLVPAFVGLGTPYWDSDCRGALYGLTRNTGPKEIVRAALEAVCYQTRDLLDAMRADMGVNMGAGGETILRVDGGMVASNWTMQCLADFIAAPVDRPKVLETTALGAAYLAGLEAGFYPEPAEFTKTWALDRRFQPTMSEQQRAGKHAGWRDSVRRTLC